MLNPGHKSSKFYELILTSGLWADTDGPAYGCVLTAELIYWSYRSVALNHWYDRTVWERGGQNDWLGLPEGGEHSQGQLTCGPSLGVSSPIIMTTLRLPLIPRAGGWRTNLGTPRYFFVNSLWPSDAICMDQFANDRWHYIVTSSPIGWVHTQNDPCIWHQRRWSTLVLVMAWCLMAPSHYLKQWWLIIKGACGIQRLFSQVLINFIHNMRSEITTWKLLPHFPGANVIELTQCIGNYGMDNSLHIPLFLVEYDHSSMP